jgi:hypothetical protein
MSVKESITRQVGVPVPSQRLLYAGRELRNSSRTLSQLGVGTHGNILHLVAKARIEKMPPPAAVEVDLTAGSPSARSSSVVSAFDASVGSGTAGSRHDRGADPTCIDLTAEVSPRHVETTRSAEASSLEHRAHEAAGAMSTATVISVTPPGESRSKRKRGHPAPNAHEAAEHQEERAAKVCRDSATSARSSVLCSHMWRESRQG